MSILDYLKQVIGGGDPEAGGLAAASSMPSPELGRYAQDVLSGKIAAEGILGQNNYDPSQSIAQNALNPAAIQQATDIGTGLGPGAIRAFHGSPHSFDRFDLSRIGTGEGAQAYGHGLYFAESEPVARSYRDTLAKPDVVNDPVGHVWDLLYNRNASRSELLERLDNARHTAFDPARRQFWQDSINAIETGAVDKYKPPGHMYEVDINADQNVFLNWDKSLSGQSEQVQRALGFEGGVIGRPSNDLVSATIREARESGVPLKDYPPYRALQEQNRRANEQTFEQLGIRNVPGFAPGDLPASAYHTGMLERLGEPAAVSARFKEAGIPGIRYLDQGSRGAGEGTSNYAVFDDKLIQILRKYGIVPPLAAGGLLGTGQEEQP